MKKLIFILLFVHVAFFVSGQSILRAHPYFTSTGEEYIDYLAAYFFTGDYTDEGGNWDGTNNGASITSEKLAFPASDGGDYMSTPTNMLPSGIDTFTISLNLNIVENLNENYYFMGDCVRNTGDDGFYIYADNTGAGKTNISFYVQNANGSRSAANMVSGGSCQSLMTTNAEHHLIIVVYYVNSSTTRVIYWVDGTYCADTGADSTANKGLAQDGTSVWVGVEQTPSWGMREDGTIDDLMFFDGDLRIKYPAHNYIDDLIADPKSIPILQ